MAHKRLQPKVAPLWMLWKLDVAQGQQAVQYSKWLSEAILRRVAAVDSSRSVFHLDGNWLDRQ